MKKCRTCLVTLLCSAVLSFIFFQYAINLSLFRVDSKNAIQFSLSLSSLPENHDEAPRVDNDFASALSNPRDHQEAIPHQRSNSQNTKPLKQQQQQNPNPQEQSVSQNHSVPKDDQIKTKNTKPSEVNATSQVPITTGQPNTSVVSQNKTISTLTQHVNESKSFTTVSDVVNTTTSLPSVFDPCPAIPKRLVGRMKIILEPPEIAEIEAANPALRPGGRFKPASCQSQNKVAIIIPYRNRTEQLNIFLNFLHPVLQRQDLDYGIFVVDQAGDTKFNRAMLFNVGFVEAMKVYDWDCFVFHDVDLLPEDDRNLYTCPEEPRHMSVAINTMKYQLPYAAIFGGVSAMRTEHFRRVNGFSNQFWGWGGEDDDMSNRLKHQKLKITRYKPEIARYTMVTHKKEEPNKERVKILKKGKKYFKTDGLVNLEYDLLTVDEYKLYTNITVELHPVKAKK